MTRGLTYAHAVDRWRYSKDDFCYAGERIDEGKDDTCLAAPRAQCHKCMDWITATGSIFYLNWPSPKRTDGNFVIPVFLVSKTAWLTLPFAQALVTLHLLTWVFIMFAAHSGILKEMILISIIMKLAVLSVCNLQDNVEFEKRKRRELAM